MILMVTDKNIVIINSDILTSYSIYLKIGKSVNFRTLNIILLFSDSIAAFVLEGCLFGEALTAKRYPALADRLAISKPNSSITLV